MALSTLAKLVDKMYILLLSFAIVYNCATENPVAIFNTSKNGLTKCIYNYFLIMHVIAQFDYHTLKKSTKYETNAELYTQVSYFVLFTFKKCFRSHVIGTITIWTNSYGPVRNILVLIAYALSLL